MAVEIKEKVSLGRYTTFQIGGEADFFCRVKSKKELTEALKWAKENEQEFIVIGGGSNLLIGDKGIRGLVILNRGGDYEFKDERVVAESGANLSMIARDMVVKGYAGLDFATSIPGTIGGAAAGNAGAYGKDMSKCVVSGEVWENGKTKTYFNDDFEYIYRGSRFKRDTSKVLLTVTVKVEKGDIEEMKAASNADVAKRSTDYSGANAGSYFTNIEESDLNGEQRARLVNYIKHGKVAVGRMIADIGLKGLKVGGAMVSENHANVVLNTGGATAKDVLDLERAVIDKVMAAYGVILRPEVMKIGEF